MLKLGEKIINNIYLGNKKIAKVFLGDKLVYQSGKPVFLDYVESTGEQYINTDYIMTSDVQEVECEFQYTDKTDTQQIFGTNTGSSSGIYPSTNSGNIYIRGGSNLYVVNFAMDYTKKHTLYAKAEVGQLFIATFDGETKQSTNAIDVINKSNPWYLFGLNNGKNSNAIYKYKGRIYLFKMYDNGVLVRDLRPCVDPKGVVCMYDMVTKKYFYNQGTGTLTAGNKINFVDYINFDGASYIDTGIVPVFGDKIEIYGSLNKVEGVIYYLLFSAGRGNYQFIFLSEVTTNRNTTYYKYFETGGAREINNPPTKMTFIECFADGAVYFDGKQVLAPNAGLTAQTVNTNMFIGVRADKSLSWRGNVGTAKLIASDGAVKFDLRPCVVAGEAGFYDMVTGKIFTNAGTGTLGYTEE